MQDLLLRMVDETKKNKKAFHILKSLSIKTQQFELAAALREIQNENFPETDEEKKAKQRARDLNLLFRMAELNIPENMCWLIDQLIKGYDKKKGAFSIEDAVKIKYKNSDIFNIDDE